MRLQEIINLIDCMREMSKECISNFDQVNLDSRLITMGHGLGGTTAIQVAACEPKRVKCVFTLDPWLHPIKEQTNFTLIQPHCCVTTEFFQSTTVSDELMKNNLK